MHILYVSFPGGGLETNVRVLKPALEAAGHQVSILYLYAAAHTPPQNQVPPHEYHRAFGNWHYYFHRATWGITSLPLVVRAIETEQALARAIGEIHHAHPIDLIEIPEVDLSPRTAHEIPFVVRLHGAEWAVRRLTGTAVPADTLLAQRERRTLGQARGISAPSRALADYVRRACRLDPLPVEIIPYPVQLDVFKPAVEKPSGCKVLFVGRVDCLKGADLLLRAVPRVLAQCPEARFEFAGQVDPALYSMDERAGPQVKFLGRKTRSELVELYQGASVLVVPSLWDNSPNVIYEAMASGVPVVATRVGGIPELVEDGVTGLLVDVGDDHALSAAVIELLKDSQRRTKMGLAAREKAVRLYRLDRILEQTLALYQRAISHDS